MRCWDTLQCNQRWLEHDQWRFFGWENHRTEWWICQEPTVPTFGSYCQRTETSQICAAFPVICCWNQSIQWWIWWINMDKWYWIHWMVIMICDANFHNLDAYLIFGPASWLKRRVMMTEWLSSKKNCPKKMVDRPCQIWLFSWANHSVSFYGELVWTGKRW